MIRNWLIKLFWSPFERLCRYFPLVPIKSKEVIVAPGIKMLVLNNVVTKFLSKFGGGFDYAVIYFVDGELFFDTGYSWASRTLKNKIFSAIDRDRVKFIINSHAHEDHTGNNRLFAETFLNSKTYAHKLALMNVAYPPVKPWYRRFLFGPEDASAILEVLPEIHLQSKRKLNVIHTPGHTDGHICLYDPDKKVLFSGDLFISESLDTQLEEADGPEWIKSLETILELDIELILDGHGVVISGEDCKRRLQSKLDYLRMLRARVREIALQGSVSQAEFIKALNNTPGLVNFLSQGEGWMSLLTSGNFSRSNLIRGFLKEFMDTKNG